MCLFIIYFNINIINLTFFAQLTIKLMKKIKQLTLENEKIK